ncbi:MAG: hypothetical protein ACXWNB_02085 [Candidatus Binataceae bacterium]
MAKACTIAAAAAAIFVLFIGIASAQTLPMPGIGLNADRPETPDERAKRKAIDDEYKSTIRKIPDKQKPADPWANIRPTTTTPSKR